jgi:chorismate dehydratase
MRQSLRLATVPYCNTFPLIHYLPEYLPETAVSAALPSELRQQFDENKIDLALMPVAELMFLQQCKIISNCCIGSNGAVRSVLLFSKKPIEQIQTIALDAASRSSITIGEILLRHFYRIEPVKQILPLDQNLNDCPSDAFIVIGDRALAYRPSGVWNYRYDIGELWKEATGLPLVFAAWIGTESAWNINAASALASARDRGLQNIETILETKTELPQSKEAILDYYRRAIVYTMRQEERTGLQLFFDLAFQYGLAPQKTVPKFF